MPELLSLCVAGLMFSLLLGLLRVQRGPEVGDRMLAAQLIGSTGVAMLLLLSVLFKQPALTDVALILALLAAVAAAAFSGRQQEPGND